MAKVIELTGLDCLGENDWKLVKIQLTVTYTGQVRRVANGGRTLERKEVKDIKGHFKSRI